MLRVKSIHKRKAKKFYGYFFLSVGIFCVVLSLCMTAFFLLHRNAILMSPLGKLQISAFSGVLQDAKVEETAKQCAKYNLSCQGIILQGNTITFTINSGVVILSTTKSIEQQIGSLQLTIRALTMEGKEFHRLDFRYDRPVISN